MQTCLQTKIRNSCDSGAGQGSIRYTDNTSGLTRSSGEANKGGGGGGTNNSSGHVGGGSGGSGVVIADINIKDNAKGHYAKIDKDNQLLL